MTIVAFQGVHGAYSEEAIRLKYGESAETMPCASFDELFRAVESRRATLGMLPVENSLAGTVATSYELLLDFDLRIQAEVILRVRHALLAPAGTTIQDVRRVRSHPQALAQCERYLARRGFQAIVHFDTAGSARDLAAAPEPNTASIASALAGKRYDLEVLDYGIEDQPFNYTRFFVIGHGTPPVEAGIPMKTSVVFALQDAPGALYGALGEFASRGINLTKIESKPRRNKPWQYYFYLDFDGRVDDPLCDTALMGLLKRTAILKLLGSYPAAAPTADDNDNGEH
ncbi:MAG TPA: prephenate dehydratase [Aggregatilineales bacterium]|nr:prephenate dehydratase [Anaerolineales bacterium]HRE47817.1 prephenate dehydratase [Aggregatilineales bacterium]